MGVSGGAVVACLATLCGPSEIEAFHRQWALRGQNFTGLDHVLSKTPTDSVLSANGRVVIGLTRLTDGAPMQTRRYNTPSDLRNAVARASCDIPPDFHPLDIISPWSSTLHANPNSKRVKGALIRPRVLRATHSRY